MARTKRSPLPKSFFTQPTRSLARNLLGKVLEHQTAAGVISGRIVETEAYLSQRDPACHAAKGMTKRNAPMFGTPGTAYVYLIYGMYHCFNVVSAPKGIGEAVLIRALEPLEGLELMKSNRNKQSVRELCRGPGKICQALALNTAHNALCLWKSGLRITEADYSSPVPRKQVARSPRIGISTGAALPLRFFIRDSKFVSGTR